MNNKHLPGMSDVMRDHYSYYHEAFWIDDYLTMVLGEPTEQGDHGGGMKWKSWDCGDSDISLNFAHHGMDCLVSVMRVWARTNK